MKIDTNDLAPVDQVEIEQLQDEPQEKQSLLKLLKTRKRVMKQREAMAKLNEVLSGRKHADGTLNEARDTLDELFDEYQIEPDGTDRINIDLITKKGGTVICINIENGAAFSTATLAALTRLAII